MRIGRVAHRLRVSPEAIRFYEREGLLPPPRRGESGYRDYDDADLERLRLLQGLRQLELRLPEAARLAVMCEAGRCDEVSDELRGLIRQQRAEIERRLAELAHLDRRLAELDRQLAEGRLPQAVIGRSEEEADG
ncbi:MAG: hypothetical protein A2X23_04900 [Chloroflexi bacterium GWC2_73_18]|nr:MAG: hypothetical protein A2X23_04900 [Chloroflexi bacterium GWC2_73_18]